MVTRNDIIKKLVELRSNSDLPQDKASIRSAIATWLTTVDFNPDNREKILQDLDSYEEYRGIT